MASAKMHQHLATHKDLTERRVRNGRHRLAKAPLLEDDLRDELAAALAKDEALLDLYNRSLALCAEGKPNRVIRELWGDRASWLPKR